MNSSNRLDEARAKLALLGVGLDNLIIGDIPRSHYDEDGREISMPPEATVTIGLFLPSHFAPDAGAIVDDILDLIHAVLKNRT